MEERFAGAASRGDAISALACEPIGLDRVERQSPGMTPRVLRALALGLEPAFRSSEAVVSHEQGCLVVLLIGPDPKRMEAACQQWIGGAKDLRVDGLAGPMQLSLMIGYGVAQPGKRLFLDTLIQVARAGLRVARCRGVGACVHTMLYDLLQERLEQERGTKGIVVSAPPAAVEHVREQGAEGTAPAVADARPDRATATPQRGAHGGGAPAVVPAPAPGSAAQGVRSDKGPLDLAEALDTWRRENDNLRARMDALETRDDPPGGASRGTEETTATSAENDRLRIQQLERQLAKVVRALEETEERLALASRDKPVDSGVASRYRTVQGLPADAPDHDRKAALMQQIFAANLELSERLRSRS